MSLYRTKIDILYLWISSKVFDLMFKYPWTFLRIFDGYSEPNHPHVEACKYFAFSSDTVVEYGGILDWHKTKVVGVGSAVHTRSFISIFEVLLSYSSNRNKVFDMLPNRNPASS